MLRIILTLINIFTMLIALGILLMCIRKIKK